MIANRRVCADEILGAVLPEKLLEGAPSGFAATGHIGTCCMLHPGRDIP